MPPKKVSVTSFFDAAQRRSSRPHGFRIAASSNSPSHRSSPNTGSSTSTSSRPHATPSATDPTKTVEDLGVSELLSGIQKRLLEESKHPSKERIEAHRQRALGIAFGSSTHPVGSTSPGKGQNVETRRKVESDGDDDDAELCVSSVEFSLICPYSLMPMEVPVRGSECHHVQCCDLNSWVILLDKTRSLRDPAGPCPVCKKRTAASSLGVDLWMQDVGNHVPRGTHLVVLESDGSYRNADSDRVKRREMVTEVIDATQGSEYVNHFGEVVDDDDDDLFSIPALTPSQGVSCSPRPSATFFPVIIDEEDAITEAKNKRSRSVGEVQADTTTPSLSIVKTEEGSLKKSMPPPSSIPVAPTPPEDDGVTIVSYAEGHHKRHRALPSQLRIWELHCPQCGAVLVKGEDGRMLQCSRCPSEKELVPTDLIVVRRFEENPSVVMELLPDGTSLLSGVDEVAPYLLRAGFQRSPFLPSDYPPVHRMFRTEKDLTKNKGVWSSMFPLARFELDFLEACCQRIVRGEKLEDLDYRMVPPLFRIPRRRRPGSSTNTPFLSQYKSVSQNGETNHVNHTVNNNNNNNNSNKMSSSSTFFGGGKASPYYTPIQST